MIYIKRGKRRPGSSLCARGMRVDSRPLKVFQKAVSQWSLIPNPLSSGASLPSRFILIDLYHKIRTKSNNFLHLQDRNYGSRMRGDVIWFCTSVLVFLAILCFWCVCVCVCVRACVCVCHSAQIVLLEKTSQWGKEDFPEKQIWKRRGGKNKRKPKKNKKKERKKKKARKKETQTQYDTRIQSSWKRRAEKTLPDFQDKLFYSL